MRRLVLLTGLLLLPAVGAAQFGSVSGHVTCADTNLPARLTDVTLQPVPDPIAPAERDTPNAPPKAGLSTFQTRLDGSFLVSHLRPGRYFVLVERPGYLSPAAQFTREEIEHPDEETQKKIAENIPVVVVAENAVSSVDVHLRRAAEITGTVRFDDGTPVPDLMVTLSRRGKDGKWKAINTGRRDSTDADGRFREIGLPSGEYLVNTALSLSDRVVDTLFGGSQSVMMNTHYTMEIYLGDGFREKDAKSLKIADGEQVHGADITIPLAKLHTISGSLVQERTGKPIDGGTVRLYAADDSSLEIASVKVDPDEANFRFEFLPEGEYIVRVEDARDLTREQVPPPKEAARFPRLPEYKEVVARTYGRYEGPLKVEGDVTGMTLPIPARDSKSPATQAGAAN